MTNYLKLGLYILIFIVTIVLEYFLLVKNTWPWEIRKQDTPLPPVVNDSTKMCNVSGTVKDYSGDTLSTTRVPCIQCIDYIQVNEQGCTPLKSNGTDCAPYGDPRSCT
jgi:hypothetical protein